LISRASIAKAGVLALALLGVLVPSGYGAQATAPSGLIQDVTVTQTATEAGQQTGARIQAWLRKADGTSPSPTQQIVVSLPAGMSRNTGAFATCDPAALQAQGPRGCPDTSRIGTGTAVFDARPLVTDPVNATVTIFNAPGGGVLLYVFPDLGPTFVVEGRPVGASTLVFDLPPVFTVPAAPNAALRDLRLTFVSAYLVNPPYCPATGWTWGFSFTYANAEQLSLSVTVPCRGEPPPLDGSRPATCKVERDLLGEVAFAARWGTNGSGRNALGKCVSAAGALPPQLG
jgi:hypothetical protein